MARMPDISAGQASLGAAGGAAVTEVTVGLDRAWQAAGGVLEGIFGGRPWEMGWSEIVDAVGGQGGDAAAMLVPYVGDVLGVVL